MTSVQTVLDFCEAGVTPSAGLLESASYDLRLVAKDWKKWDAAHPGHHGWEGHSDPAHKQSDIEHQMREAYHAGQRLDKRSLEFLISYTHQQVITDPAHSQQHNIRLHGLSQALSEKA